MIWKLQFSRWRLFFSMKTIVESSYFLEFEGKMWHVAHLNPWKWNKIVVPSLSTFTQWGRKFPIACSTSEKICEYFPVLFLRVSIHISFWFFHKFYSLKFQKQIILFSAQSFWWPSFTWEEWNTHFAVIIHHAIRKSLLSP